MAELSRLPTPRAEEWDWQLRAACRGLDAAVFFHPQYERNQAREMREQRAKLICSRCPVVTECREHALRVEEAYGIWGGLGERQLQQLITERRRARRRALRS